MAEVDLAVFPRDFRWGVATAAYQIEGAATEDGRGPSIWDTFSAEPGRIRDGSSGAVACDHYHRYREDVDLMAGLGLDGYRFSISWPRVQPEGRGRANSKGLAFYDRLVDALLERGIAPMATLYHWDLPQPLQDAGGWRNRDTTDRLAEYATLVGLKLADRVAQWIPVNEPSVATMLGHAVGQHAPGQRLLLEALPVAHHLLLGHGRAAAALRTTGVRAIGTANNHSPAWPATDSDGDRLAADLYDTLWNRLFADPVLLGSYPEGFAELMPGTVADDLAVIKAPLDFYGVNYYYPTRIADPATATTTEVPTGVELPEEMPFALVPVEGYPRTAFGWPVAPDGLRELLVSMTKRYGAALPPLYVTENGCAYDDVPDADGAVHDPDRIRFVDGHLRSVAQAITEGADVRGYYIWSLMDNLEWAEGFTKQFGLVHVDFETQRRTPKDSYRWFADVIAAHPRRQQGPPL
jgi:beta-glucosidase